MNEEPTIMEETSLSNEEQDIGCVINDPSLYRLPRWLETPLEEGSMEDSVEVAESYTESYIFHDSTT